MGGLGQVLKGRVLKDRLGGPLEVGRGGGFQFLLETEDKGFYVSRKETDNDWL